MKESIVYFRKNGINTKAVFMRKSSGTSKIYNVSSKTKLLRATSGAVIDTGYSWRSNNTKVEIKFTNLSTNSATIFGAEDRVFGNTDVSGKYSLIGHTSLYNGLRMSWYVGKVPALGQSASYPYDTIHTMIIETDEVHSKVTCSIDGNEQIYNSADAVVVNKTVSNAIFGSNFYQTGYTQFAPCDVYYCKMWDNGELVRDFHPVKSGQTLDGTTFESDGFYDRVEEAFHGNATGNGSITYIEE